MKIALFGASGMIGQRIVAEALKRGHEITAVVRDPAKYSAPDPKVQVVQGDALDAASVAKAVVGQDVVISSVGPAHGSGDLDIYTKSPQSLTDGLRRAGVKRLLIVGGAGSLEVAPGVRLFDTPGFPEEWRPLAKAHGAGLDAYRTVTDLDWTYISPAAMITPGERTGSYRQDFDSLLTDAAGNSAISCEDYAVALLDMIEKSQFIRQRVTVAY
jgi:hypothetical protein